MSNREGWRKNAISIEVEPMPGAHLEDAAKDMLALSKLLGIGVRASFNGVRVFAWPHFTTDDMRRIYEAGTRLLGGA